MDKPKADEPGKKKSALDLDENNDFVFMAKMNKFLRVLLILPMGVFGLLAVWLTFGFVVRMADEHLPELLSFAAHAFVGGAAWAMFVVATTGAAPVRNKIVFASIMALPSLVLLASLDIGYVMGAEMIVRNFPPASIVMGNVMTLIMLFIAVRSFRNKTEAA
ncbi:MAG: hypothetical protein LBL59_04270 [Xanthomonadaceae bacterium]|jgi:hypothetical protein|nr:hypothetical protein [Xanthomonadaceae bacterium]